MPTPRVQWTAEAAGHLLRRSCLGATPEEIDRACAEGLRATVERLLTGEEDVDLFPPPESALYPDALLTLREAIREAGEDRLKREEAARELRRAETRGMVALRAWWIQRLRYSSYPLRETMALFWHGHFATSAEKVPNPHLIWLQNETFRRHALGDFRSLAREMPGDPAMMRYLDIAGSHRSKPNENFARELMELFLLGEGQYSEDDIREAARAFTGRRIHPLKMEVIFEERRFDDGTKKLFGNREAVTAEDVVDVVLSRPQCAPFIAGKLWVFFAGQPASPALVRSLGEKFRASAYNIRSLVGAILSADEFYSPAVVHSQIKSPVQWLVGSAKALECPLHGSQDEQNALRDLGQALFAPPNVKGWEGGRSWISASTFLARCNFAKSLFLRDPREGPSRRVQVDRLVSDEERRNPAALARSMERRLLATSVPPALHSHLVSLAESGGLPASDETILSLVENILSSPEYQLT